MIANDPFLWIGFYMKIGVYKRAELNILEIDLPTVIFSLNPSVGVACGQLAKALMATFSASINTFVIK